MGATAPPRRAAAAAARHGDIGFSSPEATPPPTPYETTLAGRPAQKSQILDKILSFILSYGDTTVAMPRQANTLQVREPRQLAVLKSVVRVRIFDFLALNGPSSVHEIADHLGRVPESLYYHIRILDNSRLVIRAGIRAVSGRKETLYRAAARRLRTVPQPNSRRYRNAMADTCDAVLRLAGRCYRNGLQSDAAVFGGSRRTVVARCATARLNPTQLAELNRRINAIVELMDAGSEAEGGTAFTVTTVLAPSPPGVG